MNIYLNFSLIHKYSSSLNLTLLLSRKSHKGTELNINKSLVICGPSGVGKGTIINRLLEKYSSKINLCVSHTSRQPRPGEIHGTHYYFVSKEFMIDKINSKNAYFIENAVVHGNYYGTSFDAISEIHSQNKICLLDVDINGVRQIKSSNLLSCHYVFIAPPSKETLYNRLKNRGTETIEQLTTRFQNAEKELEFGLAKGNFDKIIINDDLDLAISELNDYLITKYPLFI